MCLWLRCVVMWKRSDIHQTTGSEKYSPSGGKGATRKSQQKSEPSGTLGVVVRRGEGGHCESAVCRSTL